MNEEMIFDPFAGAVVCNCEETRPEVIGRMIPTAFTDEDEAYTCGWCRFIREFGIVEELANIEKEIMGDSLSDDDADTDNFEYDDVAADSEYDYGLEDLEDWGAFSDEGIMPGCHSSYNSEFGESFLRDHEEYDRMRRFYGATVRFARESLNLSARELSERLDLPEYIIENLEAGEESITYDKANPVKCILPVRVVTQEEIAASQCEKKWWEGKSDEKIEEKIKAFLLEYKNIEK